MLTRLTPVVRAHAVLPKLLMLAGRLQPRMNSGFAAQLRLSNRVLSVPSGGVRPSAAERVSFFSSMSSRASDARLFIA